MDEDYRPRFSFEITEEQKQRANRLLATHGLRKSLFQVILDDVLDLIEDHGQIVVGVILGGAAKSREVLPILNEADRKGKIQ